MSCIEFCTCEYYDCPHHPQKHNYECAACIEKNLKNREIPACFFKMIDAGKNTNGEYTFLKFAEQVIASESDGDR